MNANESSTFSRLARGLGTAAAGTVGVAVAGAAADQLLGLAKFYGGRSMAKSRFQGYVDQMSSEQKEMMFGQHSPEEVEGRFETMYHISPQYMANPELAATAVGQTLIHSGGLGLSPGTASEFINMESGLGRGSNNRPGLFQGAAQQIGGAFSANVIGESLKPTPEEELASARRRAEATLEANKGLADYNAAKRKSEVEDQREYEKGRAEGQAASQLAQIKLRQELSDASRAKDNSLRNSASMDQDARRHNYKMDEIAYQESLRSGSKTASAFPYLYGGLGGAALGGGIGALASDEGNRGTGALVGALVGGGLGLGGGGLYDYASRSAKSKANKNAIRRGLEETRNIEKGKRMAAMEAEDAARAQKAKEVNDHNAKVMKEHSEKRISQFEAESKARDAVMEANHQARVAENQRKRALREEAHKKSGDDVLKAMQRVDAVHRKTASAEELAKAAGLIDSLKKGVRAVAGPGTKLNKPIVEGIRKAKAAKETLKSKVVGARKTVQDAVGGSKPSPTPTAPKGPKPYKGDTPSPFKPITQVNADRIFQRYADSSRKAAGDRIKDIKTRGRALQKESSLGGGIKKASAVADLYSFYIKEASTGQQQNHKPRTAEQLIELMEQTHFAAVGAKHG